MHYNILVFPCGSEIGLEVHRSLKFSRHITLFGANSVDDHGKFVFENYISGLPFYNEDGFIESLNKIVRKYKIDAIYPAMDSVITFLKLNEDNLECKVIGPSAATSEICLSKLRTYNILRNKIVVPKLYNNVDNIDSFPVFLKPDVGYGSRGVKLAKTREEVKSHLDNFPSCLILEYLPGEEITVDCLTDSRGKLLFWGPRIRNRIVNGISVNTAPYRQDLSEIESVVETINATIKFEGAWFVQLKRNVEGKFSLLEVAARLGGSSSLHRNLGVNFALLTVFNTFGISVDVIMNNYEIELDRALDSKYRLNIDYDKVYCDFDDCLLLGNVVNTQLISFLYQCINLKIRVILITKHEFNIHETLSRFRLEGIFDEIIHLSPKELKYQYMERENAIFIDDSFLERKEVFSNLGIPVFAPDNIECLLN